MVLKTELRFGTIWCHMVPHGAKKCQNGAPACLNVAKILKKIYSCISTNEKQLYIYQLPAPTLLVKKNVYVIGKMVR